MKNVSILTHILQFDCEESVNIDTYFTTQFTFVDAKNTDPFRALNYFRLIFHLHINDQLPQLNQISIFVLPPEGPFNMDKNGVEEIVVTRVTELYSTINVCIKVFKRFFPLENTAQKFQSIFKTYTETNLLNV